MSNNNPLQTVDTVADLRKLAPLDAHASVLVLGYYAVNDGGGGVFHWNPADVSQDDGGLTLASNVAAGRWKRIYGNEIDVKWFGARGNGVDDDTAAIQAALDAETYPNSSVVLDPPRTIKTVVLSPGNYMIGANTPGGSPALVIFKNVELVGRGGPIYGPSVLKLSPGAAPDVDAIWVQGTWARGTVIRNLTLRSETRSTGNGIVVHAPNVKVENCNITGMGKNGIEIDSAIENTNCNWWMISNCLIDNCGAADRFTELQQAFVALKPNEQPTPPPPDFVQALDNLAQQAWESENGRGVLVHGFDSNGGVATGVFVDYCLVGIEDRALANCWMGCYGEANIMGFAIPNLSATFIGCHSEDCTNRIEGGLMIGGSLAEDLKFTRLGNLSAGMSRLRFGGNDPSSGDFYQVQIPDPIDRAAFCLWRVPAQLVGKQEGYSVPYWALMWSPTYGVADPTTDTLFYKTWAWHIGWNKLPVNARSVPFGWTDEGHPRGTGLPFIASPLLNTLHHWSFKTQPGPNGLLEGTHVYFLRGDTSPDVDPGWNSEAYMAGVDIFQPHVDRRVTVSVELPTLDELQHVSVRVEAYAFVKHPDPGNGELNPQYANIAVRIFSSANVPGAKLVWHFEQFVPLGESIT